MRRLYSGWVGAADIKLEESIDRVVPCGSSHLKTRRLVRRTQRFVRCLFMGEHRSFEGSGGLGHGWGRSLIGQ